MSRVQHQIVKLDALHKCPNTSCPAQFVELLKHFVSKGAANIDGMGDKWCEMFIEAGLVKDLSDLYYIDKKQLLAMDNMGNSRATRYSPTSRIAKPVRSTGCCLAWVLCT